MLTEDQKQKLQTLTNECPFPQLKLLLEKAIPRYISGEIIPKKYDSGLGVENNKYVCRSGKACLIGAALIGEKVDDCNLDTFEIYDITEAFDSNVLYRPSLLREYVLKISQVLFNK